MIWKKSMHDKYNSQYGSNASYDSQFPELREPP
jgi:hypothetical protein